MKLVNVDTIMAALSKVKEPELGRDLVTLGMIKDVSEDNGKVKFTLELTTPACPFVEEIESSARKAVESLEGVTSLEMKSTHKVPSGKGSFQQDPLPGVKNMIAIASGKGGVGKSTVSVNLASALASLGAKVGLLDADIYGPNIPVMMGVIEKPSVVDKKMTPPVSYDVKIMSLGFFYQDDTALVWRGPMVAGAIKQLLTDTVWGDLDYLIIDLPPGTGDASLTLAQVIPLSGVVIVTTPQDAALNIATKALAMFRKLKVPILGIVENMSYYVCPHCGSKDEPFGHGGGKEASKSLDVPFLGELPLEVETRIAGDEGKPIVLRDPSSPMAKAFMDLAKASAAQISISAIGRQGEMRESIKLD
ncbi:MAG: Mrp/NBP35 family ATP-binding protein [Thaumarchaeota archaeon]|nr:Mrp/NBP35 family ATP-binding protein [Nitrososphaerota archaeon]MCZ6615907.1 Mrp/NBP35 family ATP-binding protein [Nitrososphaerota archaeon]